MGEARMGRDGLVERALACGGVRERRRRAEVIVLDVEKALDAAGVRVNENGLAVLPGGGIALLEDLRRGSVWLDVASGRWVQEGFLAADTGFVKRVLGVLARG